ncbi:hypothetical protein [Methyloversatilis discipulorum]|uniref:hypothetical protein n=1 Tax=Methyloversatilis discipulorum TaxID=1119528 RepID=UPI003137CF42
METRTVESIQFGAEAIPPHSGIHWSAVFAGLAVGLSAHLLMMLIGIAAGFAVYGTGERPDGGSISMVAASWNTFNMLVSAFVGGYVAARCCALKRGSDGLLHGIVSWGATMLFFAILTGSLTGNAVTGALGVASVRSAAVAEGAAPSSIGQLIDRVNAGDREGAVALMRDRFGLTDEQAQQAVDEAMAMLGPDGTRTAEGLNDAAKTASIVSTWLSVAILLSLLSAAAGGALGARSTRKRSLPRVQTTRATVYSDGHPSPMRG